jgi:hypothetical protein
MGELGLGAGAITIIPEQDPAAEDYCHLVMAGVDMVTVKGITRPQDNQYDEPLYSSCSRAQSASRGEA